MNTHDWHRLEAAEVLDRLQSDGSRGLAGSEAARRLAEYGPNQLQLFGHVSPWSVLLRQFQNVLVVILLAATALSIFLGHGVEATAIAVIVLLAALLGFLQEYRAERAIEALREMASPTATVLRDGEETEIPAREVVPGDLMLLRAGDKVPADGRLLASANLQIEESALTGESVPVEKQTSRLTPAETAAADRKNMAYAGTTVTYGRGRAVATATGMQTEFGRIAQMLQTVKPGRTPLQDNLNRMGHTLARVALGIVLVIVALGLWRGSPFMEMLIFGIALAVAVVPEALPAVVAISLAIGVQRMAKRNALVRHLPAVETLGSTSVICSDKTGTLTRDEMTVRKIFAAGKPWEVSGSGYEPRGEFLLDGSPTPPDPAVLRLLQAAVLASDAGIARREPGDRWRVQGDPTEGALVVAAAKAGLHRTDLDARFPRIGEVPFTAETKRMTTLHAAEAGSFACAKGAPEVILPSCAALATVNGEAPLDPPAREGILRISREMASQALRVLAVAAKSPATLDSVEKRMTLLGLVGMADPPRPEARTAIRTCETASIKPVMVTGDHPLTARAVALELGLLKNGQVVSGTDLDGMDEAELKRRIEAVDVFARVSPAHKLRIVAAFQERGHVVAMTGDGVNDAPALKKADIGIAMGITGTDVTKEAAVMTLTDDNFASIVAAVEEGRAIFENIKKYLTYLLSCNIGEIGLLAGATLMGLPLPLSAVQILYVNLATDGLPALALAMEPPEADLMSRKPRDPRAGVFTRGVISLMAASGLWSALMNLGLFAALLRSGRGLSEAMAMTFVALILVEFVKAYNFRSGARSLLRRPFANKWLNIAILWETALLFAIVYLPFLQAPFDTFSLRLADWAIIVVPALTISPVLEAAKWLERRAGRRAPENGAPPRRAEAGR